jgi:uncharacterized membrane protein YphA (DoxX/SURF4 family)
MTKIKETASIQNWRLKGLGLLRIVFGFIWLFDAQFKWRPYFINHFLEYITDAQTGQPAVISKWLGTWIHIIQINPHLFGYIVAISETAIGLGLIFGFLSNLTFAGGTLLSLLIWSTAEGFGGPYVQGSTDIGTAIIYVFTFVALFLTKAGLYYGLDRRISGLLGRWKFLASGKADSISDQ